MNNTTIGKMDIISAFQNSFTNQPFDSWPVVLFALGMAFAVGLFIYWVYTKTYRGVMFSPNFGLTLVMMTLVTTTVVMCIKSSLQLSMGMVGALSIVRFRTAVKDPLDTAYMFWSLTMGILLGASQFFMAGVAVVGIAGLIFLLVNFNFKTPSSYLLVVRYIQGAEAPIASVLRGVRQQQLKSKTASKDGIEMTVEIRLERPEVLLNRLLTLDGVSDATVVAYQNDTL